MKKLFTFAMAVLLALSLCACTAPQEEPEATLVPTPAPTPTPEPVYIWTISVDGTESQIYADGQLTANYTVHLSASKEGGDTPLGDYRGEIRVEYEGVLNEMAQSVISMMQGSYDFEGWGENNSFTFTMAPYAHDQMMDFVATAYQGEGARIAPVLEGIGMYTAEDIQWTEKDWSMGIDARIDGLISIDAYGDDTAGFGSVYSPFGSSSASSDGPVPLRCTIHFIDENRVQFNIWSHGTIDVNLSFNGTLDKVLLSDTIAVS